MRVGLFKLGLALFLAGFAVACAAVVAPVVWAALAGREGAVGFSGGGCVLVMFVPICFGVGEVALPLMVLAAVAAAVLVIAGLVIARGVRPGA